MGARLRNGWDSLRSSLWFVPAVLVALAGGLVAATLLVDERLPDLGGSRSWLFGGSASAARDVLAVVAGSLITVVALAFSVTIVAIQQAATQFSPRVIRNFMADRSNQVVFGTYIATFVFALLVLRQVREDQAPGGGFVPALSITITLVLALVCVALLIYFIHHVAASLQVATITDNIHRDLREGLDRRYPAAAGKPLDAAPVALPATPPVLTVPAPASGYLRAVAVEQLAGVLPAAVTLARVRPQVGDYVPEGGPLLDLWAVGPLARADLPGALTAAFTFDREPSMRQDVRFGLRQLVDIALKALSPGINDPTTAEQCLSHLGDIVGLLGERPFPPAWQRPREGGAILALNRPDFADLVDAAFGQIRRQAAGDVHVTGHLLVVLEQVAPRVAAAPGRVQAIRHQVHEVLEALEWQRLTVADAALLRGRARAVLDALAHGRDDVLR